MTKIQIVREGSRDGSKAAKGLDLLPNEGWRDGRTLPVSCCRIRSGAVILAKRSNIVNPSRALGRDPGLTDLLNHCHCVLEKKATLGLQF